MHRNAVFMEIPKYITQTCKNVLYHNYEIKKCELDIPCNIIIPSNT